MTHPPPMTRPCLDQGDDHTAKGTIGTPFRTVHAAITMTRSIRATNPSATAAVMLREVSDSAWIND